MNIFVTSKHPHKCARNLDDKRIGKLLSEANQMMSLAIKRHVPDWRSLVAPNRLCAGLAHHNHPVAVWVRRTSGNTQWTWRYAEALAHEYERRYGKPHGSAQRLDFLSHVMSVVPEGPLQPFQNSARNQQLGLDFTHLPVLRAYRAYLIARWHLDKRAVTFTRRPTPKWRSEPT